MSSLTRHILEQTRQNGDDLAAIKTHLHRVECKVDGLDQKIDGVEGRLNSKIDGVRQDLTGLRGMVAGLTTALPGMIGDLMREVLRERGGKV